MSADRPTWRGAVGTFAIAALALAGCGGDGGEQVVGAPSGASSPTATAEPASGIKPLARALPERIEIPKLGVDAPVMELGLSADQSIEEPPLSPPNITGWYEYGPTPGELGPAVVLGHVDAHGEAAVFFRLKELGKGDKIRVVRKDGSVAVFAVDQVKRYPKEDFPTQRVYGNLDHAGIRLITCGGVFNDQSGHYKDNVIAFGQLVSTEKAG